MCKYDFVCLLLADPRIPFFLQNTHFLNAFISDVSKKSGKERQKESERLCSNTPFQFSDFRGTCSCTLDTSNLQKSDPFKIAEAGHYHVK